MNTNELKHAMHLLTSNNDVPFITGRPGGGKSETVKQFAQEKAKELGMEFYEGPENYDPDKFGFIDLRLNSIDVIDLSGLPMIDKEHTVTKFTRSPYIPAEGHGILFCHNKDTDIMTDKGWVKFPELTIDHKVAQFNPVNRNIDFVTPNSYIKTRYKGKLNTLKRNKLSFSVTDDHGFLWYNKDKTEYAFDRFADIKPSTKKYIPLVGKATGQSTYLTQEEKLAIAFQADGSIGRTLTDMPYANKQAYRKKYNQEPVPGNVYLRFKFKKEHKIKQFIKDFSSHPQFIDLGIQKNGMRSFGFINMSPEIASKNFYEIFDITTFSYEKAVQFLDYLKIWGGFSVTENSFGYGNINKDSVDFVQQIATLAGRRATISELSDDRKETYSTYYKVHIAKNNDRGNWVKTDILKYTEKTEYDDYVYCVSVPTGYIITRYNNNVLISHNCDELPQSKPSNMAAVSQLILDKRVGSYSLGDNWKIIAAGNRTSDRATANRLPTHIANRLTTLELDFDINTFVDYLLANNVDESAIAFAKYRPDLLESFNPEYEVNCTPRSFVAAARYLDLPEDVMYPLMAGTIGEGATAEFVGFNKIYKNLPDLQEFLDKPTTIKIPEEADLMFATMQMLSHNANKDNIATLNKFIKRVEKDAPERVVNFWKDAIKRNVDLFTTPEFVDFSSNNKDILL